MTHLTYSGVFRLSTRRYAAIFDVAAILAGSLFIGLSAQVGVRLPFSPVPITGQTLAVLLVGALLGSRRGALAVVAYLAEGLAGLPVFANGMAGPVYFFGPTGGYLLGFVAAAAITGALAERGWDRRSSTTVAAMLLGDLAIYAFGLAWLLAFVGLDKVLFLGLFPFIPGDLLKLALAAAVLPSGWRLLGTDAKLR